MDSIEQSGVSNYIRRKLSKIFSVWRKTMLNRVHKHRLMKIRDHN